MPDPNENVTETTDDGKKPIQTENAEQELPGEQEGAEAESVLEGEEGAEDTGGEEGVDDAGDGPEKPDRRKNRIQTLSNALQEEKERNAKRDGELEELRRQIAASRPKEDPAAEEARMALMTPEERSDYKLNKAEQRNAQNIAGLQFQLQDGVDKASFDAKAQFDPLAKKHALEIERRLAEMRKTGVNAPRDAILTYLLGEQVRAQGSKKKSEQTEQGKKNIERQKVSVTNNKGDTQTNRGKTPKTAEERLAGVIF